MFDTYVGPILLYKPEVSQFKKLATNYKPVIPKKVLFPGPVIMPSRLRSQSRFSGVGVPADGDAEVAMESGARDTAQSGSYAENAYDDIGESTSRVGGEFVTASASEGLKREADDNDEEDEDATRSTTTSTTTTTAATARAKIEPSESDDKENYASFLAGGEAAEGGSSNDDGSTEAGSSSLPVGQLGRAYLASSRDRLSDSLIDAIENWRLVSQETIQKFPNAPSLLYGAHHFLRLFVHLPQLLSYLTDINAVKLNTILFHVEGILNYIDDNAEFFLTEDFANSALVTEELNANCARNKLH